MNLVEPPAQVSRQVIRVHDGSWVAEEDSLAAEEPMEIRLLWGDPAETNQTSIAVTMRTPGDDFELAVGFLRGEGIIARREDVYDVSYCVQETELQQLNIVSVTLRPDLEFDLARLERHFYTTSSCGICGKASLEMVDVQGGEPLPPGPQVRSEVICSLPQALRDAQSIFRTTGGLHASGLFDLDGKLLDLREDVGRHNALDKLTGYQFLRDRVELTDRVLLLSGRASFELIQKALMARIPIVAAVGAPSSLAVDLAESFNITLLGFVRSNGFNIYTGAERVIHTP